MKTSEDWEKAIASYTSVSDKKVVNFRKKSNLVSTHVSNGNFINSNLVKSPKHQCKSNECSCLESDESVKFKVLLRSVVPSQRQAAIEYYRKRYASNKEIKESDADMLEQILFWSLSDPSLGCRKEAEKFIQSVLKDLFPPNYGIREIEILKSKTLNNTLIGNDVLWKKRGIMFEALKSEPLALRNYVILLKCGSGPFSSHPSEFDFQFEFIDDSLYGKSKNGCLTVSEMREHVIKESTGYVGLFCSCPDLAKSFPELLIVFLERLMNARISIRSNPSVKTIFDKKIGGAASVAFAYEDEMKEIFSLVALYCSDILLETFAWDRFYSCFLDENYKGFLPLLVPLCPKMPKWLACRIYYELFRWRDLVLLFTDDGALDETFLDTIDFACKRAIHAKETPEKTIWKIYKDFIILKEQAMAGDEENFYIWHKIVCCVQDTLRLSSTTLIRNDSTIDPYYPLILIYVHLVSFIAIPILDSEKISVNDPVVLEILEDKMAEIRNAFQGGVILDDNSPNPRPNLADKDLNPKSIYFAFMRSFSESGYNHPLFKSLLDFPFSIPQFVPYFNY